MMKRILFMILSALLVFTTPALAFDKEKVEVGVEYGYSHQDIENVGVATINLGGFINGGLIEKTSNVKQWSALMTLGYELSDQLTPYLVLGNGWLDLDQELVGNFGIGGWSGSTPILVRELRGASGFMIGGGAKGNALKFNNGINIGYDARWTTMDVESDQEPATLLPSFGSGFLIKDNMKASLGVFNLDIVANKYFDLTTKNEDGTITKKYKVEGVTPFLGGRWTHSDLNVKNELSVGKIDVGTEMESQGNMLSGLAGASVKITKNIDVSVGGVFGQENGIQIKTVYKF